MTSLVRHETEKVGWGPNACPSPSSGIREHPERAGSIRAGGPRSWVPWPRMGRKAIRFERIRRPPHDSGYMPPPHGCPPFLIGRAFSAMLSLKGDHKKVTGSKGMTSGLSMSVALAGAHPGKSKAVFPDAVTAPCSLSFRLAVFQG